MKRFYIYEGIQGQRMEEGDRFDSLEAAIERAKINASNAEMENFIAHVRDNSTGEVVFTVSFR